MTSPIIVLVQARMRSSRLPGKIAAMVCGRPMLGRVVSRLQAASPLIPGGMSVVVATSTAAADDATEQLCRELGVGCFRGSEDDVLARYLAASAHLADGDTVLRATADNCLYCPVRTAKIVAVHRQRNADYTSIENLSYVVPEVVQVGALREMARRAALPFHREHVTPYFREHQDEFKVVQLPPAWEGLRPEIRLTVDTPEELKKITWVYERLSRAENTFTLEDVYELWTRESS
jgi:spore coat polysaccharide biosynthesis protein SpsF